MWPFRKKAAPETRASVMTTGYTAEIMAARQSYISGMSGLGELTAVVQTCVSLWEGALSTADVEGTDLLDRRTMALLARSLALRGEAMFLVRDRLIPVSDWDVATRNGRAVAYRCSLPDAGGGRTETALAAEVLHVVIGSDATAPWTGTSPLRRANLSASLLHEVESALRDTFRDAPFGSQTLPVPAVTPEMFEQYRGKFTGRRGATLLFGPQIGADTHNAPAPAQLTPKLAEAETVKHLEAARGAISQAFGVLPALHNPASAGPVIREAQRHLAQWTLEPLSKVIAEEAEAKLGGSIQIDCVRPLQAFDVGGKARAFSAMVRALAEAKEAGIDPAPLLAQLDVG